MYHQSQIQHPLVAGLPVAVQQMLELTKGVWKTHLNFEHRTGPKLLYLRSVQRKRTCKNIAKNCIHVPKVFPQKGRGTTDNVETCNTSEFLYKTEDIPPSKWITLGVCMRNTRIIKGPNQFYPLDVARLKNLWRCFIMRALFWISRLIIPSPPCFLRRQTRDQAAKAWEAEASSSFLAQRQWRQERSKIGMTFFWTSMAALANARRMPQQSILVSKGYLYINTLYIVTLYKYFI